MLLGRTAERTRIDELLGVAKSGTSGALVLRGEPGIGKTALLDYAAERAEGMSVLRARGVESESELPFSGLSELLHPHLHRIERIPRPQADALAGALAIGPPVAADRFAVSAATLSLVAAVAESKPVLVAIDDVQWMDGSSSEALAFTARRIHAEGIVMLFAERASAGFRFETHGLEEMLLEGLDRQSSETLLTQQGARVVSREVADRIFEATRGNALAVLEIGAVLSDAQLRGAEPLDDPLPGGASIERVLLRRAEGMDEDSRTALVVMAASETGELEEIMAALGALHLGARELDAVEERGIISVQNECIEWRHPLYRSVAYYNAPGALRRRAHRAIAESLRGNVAAPRRAWHRAAATVGPDEQVAADLERAAREARQRLGHAAAVRAFDRAARLTTDPELRARRLLEAGRDLLLLGRFERAVELLEEAVGCTSDPRLRAEIQHQRGSLEMWIIGPGAARALLVDEATRVEELDPSRAAMMLAEAAVTYTMDANIDGALRMARRAEKVAESAPESVQVVTSALVGVALVLMGRAKEGRPLVLKTGAVFESIDPLDAHPLVHPLAHVAVWLEDYEVARRVLDRVIDAARRAGAIGLMVYPLACLSELDFRMGRWSAAYAAGHESVQFSETRRQENQLSFSLVCLAMVEAGRGQEAECRAHLARALELCERFGIDSIMTYAHVVLGFLEIGLARPHAAIEHLELVSSLVAEQGVLEPGVVEWAGDLVVAYARLGRTADADRILSDFAAVAERTGRVSALATAERCRGVLEPSSSFEKHFDAAFRWLEDLDRPFERARTELYLGMRLRRERHLVKAREPLRRALGTFESLGARPWAEQARAELLAAGGGRPVLSTRHRGVQELGPQELKIALLVADGLTNREIAAALFLSPKTIEFHLGKIYRKLSIRSRAELARLVAEDALASSGHAEC